NVACSDDHVGCPHARWNKIDEIAAPEIASPPSRWRSPGLAPRPIQSLERCIRERWRCRDRSCEASRMTGVRCKRARERTDYKRGIVRALPLKRSLTGE